MDQDPLLELDEPVLQVEPGGEVRTRLTVHNSGADVERYRLEILGDAARWAHVEPRHVTAQPGAAAPGVDVVFRPPPASRSAASARDVRFGVRALSLENRDRAGVVEGDLQISPVRDLAARIEPARAVGRWSAAYRAVLDNRGGWPLTLRLSGGDQHQALSYAVAPRELTIPPGGSGQVLLAVRPRQPKIAGPPVRHGFGLEYHADDGASSGWLPATFEQRGVLPVPVVATGLVLALVLAVGAAMLALRPGAEPANTTAAGPAASSPAGAGPPVQGFLVIYGPPTPIDDAVSQGDAERFVAELQAVGIDARLVDSRRSDQVDDGLRGLWVVLKDGFDGRETAQAECDAHRDVAPACNVVPPR